VRERDQQKALVRATTSSQKKRLTTNLIDPTLLHFQKAFHASLAMHFQKVFHAPLPMKGFHATLTMHFSIKIQVIQRYAIPFL